MNMRSSAATWAAWTPLLSRRVAEYYEKEIGYHIPERTPLVGKNFNVTRAGIHADGLLKNEEIYNVFDTENS